VLRPKVTRFHIVVAGAAVLAAAIITLCSGPVRWGLLTGLCTMTGLLVGLGVSFPHLQMFGRSLCRIRTSEKAVALTFDDGPDPQTTPAVLDFLRERGLRATFFCVGEKVRKHTALASRIASEGHEVENHSFSHSPWTNLFTTGHLKTEMERTQSEIAAATGRTPVFFRPPIGLTNLRVFKAARASRLEVVGYTVRGLDRRDDPPERIAGRLLTKSGPGAILLLHDAGVPMERTLRVLQVLSDDLGSKGYTFRRLDEFTASGHNATQAVPAGTRKSTMV